LNSRMVACFQTASDAYTRGFGACAQHYSRRGQKLRQQRNRARAREAKLIFASQNPDYTVDAERMRIDLHGLRVGEALSRVAKTIEVMRNAAAARAKHGGGGGGLPDRRGRLTIITGRGVHSAGGKARIKPAVEQWLRQQAGLTCEGGGPDAGQVTAVVPW
jgi:DNA-nicking Smr family endonuclease